MAMKKIEDTFYISHGPPTLSIEETCIPLKHFLQSFSQKVYPRRPSSILLISAHWETEHPTVNVVSDGPSDTIYDFQGFPEPIYQLKYPAPGAPKLAKRVKELLMSSGFNKVDEEDNWGLDHGAWAPLMLMYPEADIPLCQLSIQTEKDATHIYIGKGLGSFKLEELLVEDTWLEAIPGEFENPYAKKLSEFVESEIQSSIPIYPPQHLIFNALNSTPFDQVKAVIIGQDPYHGPGQAMGLSFSVPQGIKIPSSLLNIYKELQQDLGCSIPSHGNLERWAVQGVLLLNAVLTVRQHQANSHAKKGWEQFTDSVIETISKKKTGIVFLLWGNYAQAKSRLIDEKKHHILKAAILPVYLLIGDSSAAGIFLEQIGSWRMQRRLLLTGKYNPEPKSL